MARENRAAGGTGLHQPHRELDRGLERRDTSAGEHKVKRAIEAALRKHPLEAAQVGAHERLHVSIGASGRDALVLAHLRRDLRGQTDFEVRASTRQDLGSTLLVSRIGIAMQVPDCHRGDTFTLEHRNERFHRPFLERNEDFAARAHSFRYR